MLRLYEALPVCLQNAACSWYGWKEAKIRYTPWFLEKIKFLDKSQWWCREEIADFQDAQLVALVRYCYEAIPYYRNLMDENKLSPADIRGKKDLWKFPLLTKEDIRRNGRKMLSKDARTSRLVQCHTSGTTGTALHFSMSVEAIAYKWAVWWRHKMRFGVSFDSWHANFTGKLVVPSKQNKPPYWRVSTPLKQVIFNMQHMVPERIRFIVERLNDGEFEYFTGYPSILYIFSTLVRDAGLKLKKPPKMVFTGAENLLEHYRQVITETIGCPVTDQYGFSEGAGNASRCERDVFHEDFEYGILECADGEAVAEGIRGKIIGTGFSNLAMPFIRYDIGDTGIWKQDTCRCGRESMCLVGIDGRNEDFVVTPEGRRIMRFDYLFKDTINIRECQVLQDRPGEMVFRIVRGVGYNGKDEKKLRRDVEKWISPALLVRFEYVESIPRDATGKFRSVVSVKPRHTEGSLFETTPQ